MATVGSCALISLVVGDKLYVANLGDSKACLLREKPDDPTQFEQVPLSVTHNANKAYEQKCLQSKFYREKDIIVCRKPRECYVKNRLMPTRSLGDL